MVMQAGQLSTASLWGSFAGCDFSLPELSERPVRTGETAAGQNRSDGRAAQVRQDGQHRAGAAAPACPTQTQHHRNRQMRPR